MYQSVISPAMLYQMETVAITEKQVGKMEVTALKMVRWALGVIKKDKKKNDFLIFNLVRGTAKIAKLGDKLRDIRICWYGHVKRREGCVGKRMIKIAIPGKRKRRRPKRCRWI